MIFASIYPIWLWLIISIINIIDYFRDSERRIYNESAFKWNAREGHKKHKALSKKQTYVPKYMELKDRKTKKLPKYCNTISDAFEILSMVYAFYSVYSDTGEIGLGLFSAFATGVSNEHIHSCFFTIFNVKLQ